jgi:MoxR-like ATPase
MADEVTADDAAEGQGALEGGAYDIIRARLDEQSGALSAKAEALNTRRVQVFGGIETTVLGNERIRTENNCVPVDIIEVGGEGLLLFGYTVFLGLKREHKLEDVFSVQRFSEDGDTFVFESVPTDQVPWLADEQFAKDFSDLYQYYKAARLIQLMRTEADRLLAVFQVGDSLRDVKVFRWGMQPDGTIEYIDARGEADYGFPPSHDFDWVTTGRDEFVQGRHPHVNVLDQVFVETVGGDLTVKVEDNTEDGQGIYREPVDDANQSLDDGDIAYASLGALILLRVLPYREEQQRYLVFNTRTHDVARIDDIGTSCVQLPEDHGVIFPGGYYLQDGAYKTFEGNTEGMTFLRVIRSPNGEDVMYVFYEKGTGRTVLLPYNLIRKEVSSPIHCHGYCIFDNGHMVVFRSEAEPTRVHHMRVWQTPFLSVELAAQQQAQSEHAGSLLTKVGNADLVRGISDCHSVRRQIANQSPSAKVYEDLIASCTRIIDAYPWLNEGEVGDLKSTLEAVRSTAELVIDEFEKVQAIQARAREALAESETAQQALFGEVRPDSWTRVDEYVDAMAKLRHQRGHLITLKDMRYMDTARVDELEAEVQERFKELSDRCTDFLLGEDALSPYKDQHAQLEQRISEFTQTSETPPLYEDVDRMSTGLDLLTEVVAGLTIDDPAAKTRILEEIGEVFALVNRARATLEGRRKALGKKEGTAEFGAQFKLFGQSVQSALGLCDTPEKCDDQLTRLMVSLEELEGRFGEFDEFLGDLAAKREEVYEAFSGKKQQLLEARQRRAQNLVGAAERILEGVRRRALTMTELDDLNAYFAADAMVMKVRDLADQLGELGDSVKADEVLSRIKSTKDEAARQLRDKSELFEGGDDVIRLGNHRFTVNTQPLDLTLLPKGDGLALHLTGSDYVEPVVDERLDALREHWDQQLVSENHDVYRGEYLAATILFDADSPEVALTLEDLHEAAREDGGLLALVRSYAQTRYDEGYDRGVHDADAALILDKLLAMYSTAGLLRFPPAPRALGCLYWAVEDDDNKKRLLTRKAASLSRLRETIKSSPALLVFARELGEHVGERLAAEGVPASQHDLDVAGLYLAEELAATSPRFVTSAEAVALKDAFLLHIDKLGTRAGFEEDLRALEDNLKEGNALARAWLTAFLEDSDVDAVKALSPSLDEAVALLLTPRGLDRETSAALSSLRVEGLLGQHPRIEGQAMTLRLDEVLVRLRRFMNETVPGYQRFRQARHAVIEESKKKLRLDEFKPRVLSSFVRNKLINDVYLPFVGDNLAKQMGAVGDKKRTDLMGLLLLVSPPGYGKTTLMEYIASRLGLVFMKVNGPSLGHEVTSLDPSEAPNATARQEVEKINLAFEMGNNVLLYLDDIQHTHPELLQKFISLCDGSRRIEGVWRGNTRTYDLRGKKFAVCMAGNPYTESGEKFQIPDMLANRADTYNLGDILGGKEREFALSYVENSLTSNAVLQPLATREQKDTYLLIRRAEGEEINTSDLAHGYSAVEVDEITAVLSKMLVCRDVLLAVNGEYVRSASMDDRYRTEPPFKLQGSYRNMNKLAEKIVAVMNDDELQRVIDDHYRSESQTLTSGAEQNLLKLAELRGRMGEDEAERWEQICKTFQRNKMSGGDQDDPVMKVTSTLSGLGQRLEEIGETLAAAATQSDAAAKAGRAAEKKRADAMVAQLSTQLAELNNGLQSTVSALSAQSQDASSTLSQGLADALSSKLDGLSGELVGALSGAAATSAKATVQSAKLTDKSAATQAAAQTAALSDVLAKLDDSLAALAQSQLNVNVTAPPPVGLADAVLAQSKLVEGTLAPLLAALKDGIEVKGALAAPAAAAPAPASAPKKKSSKKAAADAPPVNVTADLGEVPGQVSEALALLRELKEMADSGELSANKSYKPWTRKPVGTSAKDE